MVKKQQDFLQRLNELEAENLDLMCRLEEAEEALNAIRAGQVDALIVYGDEGEQIYTLEGADTTYRLMVENIHEGAANITADGTILYCNHRLAEMLAMPLESVLGSSLYLFLPNEEKERFFSLARNGMERYTKAEFSLVSPNLTELPVLVTASPTLVNKLQGICLVVTDLTDQKRAAALEKSIQSQLIDQREAERLQIARNIHDGPLQEVIGLSFTLQSMITSGQDANGELTRMRENVLKLSADLRAVCNELRPPEIIRFGLAKAIQYQVEETQVRYPHLKFNLELFDDKRSLPEELRIMLFRIFQECINNVIRHAEANFIEVRLLQDTNSVLLEVQDDGKGFPSIVNWGELARQGHLGLVGMRERAEAMGGTLRILPGIVKGSTVQIEVPYNIDPI